MCSKSVEYERLSGPYSVLWVKMTALNFAVFDPYGCVQMPEVPIAGSESLALAIVLIKRSGSLPSGRVDVDEEREFVERGLSHVLGG